MKASETVANFLQGAALRATVCPRCEAKTGEPCRTLSGRKTAMHSPRWAPLAWAYYQGVEDGKFEEARKLGV